MRLDRNIPERVLRWYVENARRLPWRETTDPYRIWVSEIMLQQTRVEAVKPYYERFLAEFPNVFAFAHAPEERYLKLWEGLGYYSRVRNMHKAAVLVAEAYGGAFPAEVDALRRLPGIGTYTAGAIASIAFGVPAPAVDGNVLRVITRLAADGREISLAGVRVEIEEAVAQLIPAENPGDFNQALIELGATVCVPNGDPLCHLCPVRDFCRARAEGRQTEFPVKKKKSARRIREMTVFVITDGRRVLLRRRPEKGLLAGLCEFPNAEGKQETEAANDTLRTLLPSFTRVERLMPLPEAKHIFTHVEWHMAGYLVRVETLEEVAPPYFAVAPAELRDSFALPSAFSAYRAWVPGAD